MLALCLGWLFFTQDPIEALQRPWRGPHVSEDGWYYYHYLRSAIVSGDLDLNDDYRDVGNWYGFGVTSTGQRHNPFTIGPALLWTPGFLLGRLAARLTDASTPTVPDGMRPAEQAGALLTSVVAAVWACWLAFGLARRYVPDEVAWSGMLVAFAGGPLVWYAVYSPSMPHALEACLGAAFITQLLPLRRRSLRGATWLGLVGGLMLLVRPQLATFYAPLLYEAVVVGRRDGIRTAMRPLLLVGLVTLLVFSPQLFAWKYTYGQWLLVPQGSGFMRFGESLWSETLFSSRHGLFTTTPILWFVMPGFYALWRRDRQSAVVLSALFALQAIVNGAAWDWWGGGAFGGRRFSATFIVWAVSVSCLVGSLAAPGRWRLLRLASMAAIVVPLLALQALMIRAHHDRRFSWEDAVPFGQRVTAATGLAVPLADSIGNPFALPASALFSLRHGVPLDAYERSVGVYLLDERLPTTNPLLPHISETSVDFTRPSSSPFVGRGFARTTEGISTAHTGELFIPLNRPGSFDLEVDARADAARWSFNGRGVTPPRMHIEAAWVTRGLNVLRVEGDDVRVRAMRLVEGPEWPPMWARPYPER